MTQPDLYEKERAWRDRALQFSRAVFNRWQGYLGAIAGGAWMSMWVAFGGASPSAAAFVLFAFIAFIWAAFKAWEQQREKVINLQNQLDAISKTAVEAGVFVGPEGLFDVMVRNSSSHAEVVSRVSFYCQIADKENELGAVWKIGGRRYKPDGERLRAEVKSRDHEVFTMLVSMGTLQAYGATHYRAEVFCRSGLKLETPVVTVPKPEPIDTESEA